MTPDNGPDGLAAPDAGTGRETGRPDDGPSGPALIDQIPKLGIWAWSFVGVVIATIVIAVAFAAVSELALPLTFAAVLAVIFKPLAGTLERRGLKPTIASGLVVLALLALVAFALVATVHGVADQADQIGANAESAADELAAQADVTGIDRAAIDTARAAIEGAEPLVMTGVLSGLVSGIGTVVAVAGALILGALVMYYLLKDGTSLRRSLVRQVDESLRDELDAFIGEACQILRDYGRGRTIMSAIVSVVIAVAAVLLGLPLVFTLVVVNFVGGYIPYVGAFLGGGLAVIVALGNEGLPGATMMLIVVLAANLILENVVEPKVMGRTLDIHPVVVLVVTALGGILGGIVGLILAVPATAIAGNAVDRLRSRGIIERATEKAQPAVQHLLD